MIKNIGRTDIIDLTITLEKYNRMFNPLSLLAKYSLTNNVIIVILKCTYKTIVGSKPNFRNIYEIGTINSNRPPNTI